MGYQPKKDGICKPLNDMDNACHTEPIGCCTLTPIELCRYGYFDYLIQSRQKKYIKCIFCGKIHVVDVESKKCEYCGNEVIYT